MRKLRRGRGKRQKQILILSTLVLFSILTIGYAAFQTNISLTAKGNVSPSATYTVNDLKSLVTTVGDGLYEDADEQGRYVFKGGNPNNYLTLNGETWRIMSIESDNTIKIIREDPIGSIPFDPGINTVISGITVADSDTGTRYSTTSTDFCYYGDHEGCKVWGSKDTMRDSSGTLLKDTASGAKMPREIPSGSLSLSFNLPNDDAYLNVYLNGGTYSGVNVTGWYQSWSSNLDSDIESYIEDEHLWNVGLVSNTSGQLTATDITQEKAYTWQGRVGLMTVSEYVRASTNSECTGLNAYNSNSACYNNGMSHNYLTKDNFQWTVSPDSSVLPYVVWHIEPGPLFTYYPSLSNDVRPVLYLSPNTILKGAGTSDKKFQIANTTPNSNSGSSQGGSSSGGSGGSESGGGQQSTIETVYALNTTSVTLGTSTKNDLVSTITSQPYYTSAADVMSASGYTIYNKYTVENDTITEGYSCQKFSMLSDPVCVKGGNSSYYDYNGTTGNWKILDDLFNDSAFTTNDGSCTQSSSETTCSAGGVGSYAGAIGYVSAWSNSAHSTCEVHDNGTGRCYGW